MNVVLDACVLYPAPLRDILLHLAEQRLFYPKWSNQIQEEWLRNLLINRPELEPLKLFRTVELMNQAFQEANVEGYELIIDKLQLPDEEDRHVLAVAIASHSDLIVTNNIKDFHEKELSKYAIQAKTADEFISSLILVHQDKVEIAIQCQLSFLKKPPLSKEKLLENFVAVGLSRTVEILKNV